MLDTHSRTHTHAHTRLAYFKWVRMNVMLFYCFCLSLSSSSLAFHMLLFYSSPASCISITSMLSCANDPLLAPSCFSTRHLFLVLFLFFQSLLLRLLVLASSPSHRPLILLPSRASLPALSFLFLFILLPPHPVITSVPLLHSSCEHYFTNWR